MTKDGQAGVNISPDLTAAEAYQLLGTLALHIMNAYFKVATTSLTQNHNSGDTPKDSKLSTKAELNSAIQGIKDSMYDAMDNIFSSVLQQFQPEHPRYSLEDEAIIELTNAKIEAQYEALSPEDKAKYKDAYVQTKAQLEKDMENARQSESEQSTTDTE